MAEFKLGRLRFVWKGAWVAGTVYVKDDIIKHGGTSYVCMAAHTADANFNTDLTAATWQVMSGGTEWKSNPWSVSTGYKINDLVKYGGNVYICTANHTSSSNLTGGFEFDNDTNKWDLFVSGTDWKGIWSTDVYYKKNDIVKYNGITYICKTGHTSKAGSYVGESLTGITIVTPGNGYTDGSSLIFSAPDLPGGSAPVATIVVAGGMGQNVSGVTIVSYGSGYTSIPTITIDDIGGSNAVLVGAITSSFVNGLEDDQEKWEQFSEGFKWRGNWSGSETPGSRVATSYAINDIVKFGGSIYLCTTAHTSNPATFQENKWTIYVEGLQFEDSWSGTTEYQLGDIITYGGYAYVAQDRNTGQVPPTSPTHWSLLTTGFNNRSRFDSAQSYRVGDLVQYGGNTYVAIVEVLPGQSPYSLPSSWEKVTDGFRWTNDWTDAPTETTYKIGDIVKYKASTYICIDEHIPSESGTTIDVAQTIVLGGKLVTTGSTATLNELQPIVFSGTTFGGVTAGVTYFVKEILNNSQFTISEIAGGTVKTLSAASGLMTGTYSSRPDEDTGTFWNSFAEGDANNVLTRRGDIVTRNAIQNVKLAKGAAGTFLKAGEKDLEWSTVGAITQIYYVSTDGIDSPERGTTLNDPWRTIKYACEYVRTVVVPTVNAPAVINVKTGVYTEIFPISVPKFTSLVGDELRMSIVEPTASTSGSNKFYMRDSTTMRNFTFRGATGANLENGLTDTYTPANQYGTKRPTGGAWVSLDPGAGPNDDSVWVGYRSPYMQNITLFGDYCIGQKIDGALHNGGNRSLTSNDFTTILSNGIGAWAVGDGRAELVSVFTYYSYIGYLCESGGVLRATNGNNSYGTYGSVSEGVNPTEISRTSNVDNRRLEAIVDRVQTDGADKILYVEYTNAGETYSTAEYNFTGTGTYASVVVNPVIKNGGVTEVRTLDAGENYTSVTNNAQAGTNLDIRLGAADIALTNGYVGERILLTDGAGAGQYAYITSFDGGTKLCTLGMESFDALTVISTAANDRLTVSDTATLYADMPFTLTGTAFGGLATATQYYVKDVIGTSTIASVDIAGNAGQLTVTSGTYLVGQKIVISGTKGGTGDITGYANPTTYYIMVGGESVTSIQITDSYANAIAGVAALSTSLGTPTGLTYTLGGTQFTAYTDTGTKTAVDLSANTGTMLLHKSGWDTVITDITETFTAIAKTNPVQITTTVPHAYFTGMQVAISGVGGMTELNGNTYFVTKTGASTFTLYSDSALTTSVDGTGYTTYTTGGTGVGNQYVPLFLNTTTRYVIEPRVVVSTGIGARATAVQTSGINTISVSDGGGGFTVVPEVIISGDGTDTGGFGALATATIEGGVDTVVIQSKGTGYISAPTLTFVGGGLANGSSNHATAHATITSTIKTLEVSSGGTGYTTPPTVTATGTGGSGSILSAQISQVVGTVSMTGGSNSGGTGYTSLPVVSFSGGEPVTFAQGFAVLSAQVVSVTVQEGGSGYDPATTSVTFSSVTGSNATAHVVVDFGNYVAGITPGVITSIVMDNVGSGYGNTPGVVITGDGVNASATANISGSVTSITITNPGRGYKSTPTVSFAGGGGTGARGTPVLTGSVIAVNVVDGGRGWTTSTPAIAFSGGGGSNAVATVTEMDTVLDTIVIDTPGSGYTSNPAVSLTGGSLVYNQEKCARDVGLMIDAVTADMVFNTNYQSVKAGEAYLRSYSAVVLNTQKSQTIASINKARDLMIAKTTDSTAISRITTLFGYITAIIENGTGSVPSLTFATPSNTATGITGAAAILQANRTFVRAEIVAWINVQIAGGAGVWTGFTYDSATCSRDVGYIVDALTFDLLYGGNGQTIDVAKSYYYNGSIVAEQSQSILAMGHLQTILEDIVQNTTITKSSGNAESQNTSLTPAGSTTAATTLTDLIAIISDVLQNGITVVPDLIEPTYLNGNTTLATIRTLIRASTTTIQTAVIDFISANFVGGGGVVRARINGIVQTVTVTDPGGRFSSTPLITFANGNQFKSAFAGLRYFANASSRIAIGATQQVETLAGINHLRVVARAVAQNTAPGSIYQSAIGRTTGTAGPSGIQNAVDVWVNAVYYTIENGQNYVNAPEILTLNREFIRDEAMAFWSTNFPTIANATWSRDVGLLIDAIISDLSNEGVNHVLTACIKAIFLDTARSTNLTAATSGIEFVRDLCIDLIQNIVATPLTGITVTNATSVTNVYTAVDVSTLTVGDQVLFTGTVFGGVSANVMYYIVEVNSGPKTFQVSLTEGGTPVTLPQTTTGSMTISKQFIDQTITLESLALTALPNLFNFAKNAISTTLADAVGFDGVATLISANKNFIKAEVIAYINATYADFDYNQATCARDVGFIVDALVYDLRNAIENNPTVTSATTGVVSSITVNSGGSGYGAGTTITISGGGSPTTTATATPIYNSRTGTITGFTMTQKGRGYSTVPTVTITPDTGSGALIRAKIVGGNINKMTIIHPGSGYTAGPNIQLIDPNNTTEASFLVRTSNGVLDQPRFTGRGIGFTNADCELIGDGYADIAQTGQYVYVKSLTNIPTPGANIQFSSNPSQYYKLVTVRDVNGPVGLIGARQLLTDNKEFIQYEVINYLNNFTYNSAKCSRDVGLIIDAVADDYTYSGNSRVLAMLYQHQRGTFALFEQQRMQTAFALEELQRLLNVEFSEQSSSTFAVSRKLDFLVEWVKNKEYYQDIPALNMPDGLFDTQDDRGKNVILANANFIQAQVIAWMVNNTKIVGFNQAMFNTEIRQIVRSICYDLAYTGNSQTFEFASSYYIDGVLTIPGVPGTSAAAKTEFLEMLAYISTLLQDIAVNNNITPQSGNTLTQDTNPTPGDSATQGRIQTLMTSFSAVINDGIVGSGVTLTASNFTGYTTNRRTAILANKSTLQGEIITWMDDNFVNFTYDNDVCFRDAGLIVQAIADDIYGDVAKSVEAGQRYYAATAALVLSDQKPQTVAAINQINYIAQLVITNATYTRTQTNAFQVRYPAITTGYEAGAHIEETTRIIRTIIERGVTYNNVKQLLLDNKEYIKAETVAYVSASYENLDYNVELCARDAGLIVDAIAYDIYGGLSRSQEAGLRYYQSASALKAITGDQLAPTIAAMNYIDDLIQAILTDVDPDIKFQEAVSRTPNSSIVFPASKLLIGEKVSTCITTILGVISGGPSSLPAGRYTARLQVSPPLTIATAPAHDTAMVIRSKYSQVRLTGHDFLNIGTGSKNDTNYPGIPLNAPQQNQEITEQGGGRVFYTSTDQDGNFRVGSLFKVEQSTGIATLNADAFNLSGLNELTLGGVSLGSGGATINEFSTDGTFFANSDKVVPTQKAIKTYIQSALGSGGGNIAVNAVTAGDVFITGKEVDTVGGGQLSMISAGGVTFTSPIGATSTTEAAVTVGGGLGVAENAFIGGKIEVSGNIVANGTGYIKLPVGTTAQRTGTTEGQIRYNIDTHRIEVYNGTGWTSTDANPWTAKSTTYTAVNGDRLMVNTSGSSYTINLPASPAIGDTVRFIDATGTFDINNLIVGRNGANIMGASENLTVATQNAAFSLVFYNSTYGWRLGEA